MAWKSAFRSGLVIEWFLAFLILLSIGNTIWHLFTWNYLPAPFFYEPGDAYADWFNSAYWARNPGTFDVWSTLYPPISFIFLQIFGMDSCYPRSRGVESSPGIAARDCDWVGLASIWSLWIISVVLIYFALRKIDRKTAIPRTICVGLGWPMLNAIERGNLVLAAFPCFLLATMPLLKSAKLRWMFGAFAVNFKVYLIAPFVAQLIMRRWRWVEGLLLAVVIVYLVSYAILGRGTPLEIVLNLSSWIQNITFNPLDLWATTTYQALYSLMDSDNLTFPILLLLGSREIELIQTLITVLLRFTQAMILVAMVATWFRSEAVSRYRLFALGVLLALITTETGGYTPSFFMLLIMVERWQGFGRIFAICSCYLMAISYDIQLSVLAEVVRDTYFRDSRVIAQMNLTVWPLLRPLLIQLIAIALSVVTIREGWADIQKQGWSTRWRYRGDAPLLPWVQRPQPPRRQV